MTNQEPTRARFILCDDVRPEPNGKVTIIGYFADDKILVTDMPGVVKLPGALPVIDQFSIACVLSGGIGTYPVKGILRDPTGNVVIDAPIGDVVFQKDRSVTTGLKGRQFAVSNFGKYSVEVTVGTKAFPFEFEILAAVPSQLNSPPKGRRRTAKVHRRKSKAG